MEEQHPRYDQEIPESDWESTPTSVKRLVGELLERVEQLDRQLGELQEQNQLLREQNQLLQERVLRSSANSSQPPSQDPPQIGKSAGKAKSGKKRGGQPGHRGHHRHLYPHEACQSITDHYPRVCRCCGASLSGEDPSPYRHQVVEIPPLKPQVEEHRLHQLRCQHCGATSRAALLETVAASGYGARVVAHVGLLSGMYRHSERMVQSALQDLFGVVMSLGTVNRLRQEASASVASAVEKAHQYVQQQPVVGADETSFTQGNADGNNPQQQRAWLWVVVTPLVTFFQVLLSRSQQAAQTVLGHDFSGILTSDRHSSYNWVELSQRQLCWAHLKRDFTQIAERTGVSGELGAALLLQQEQLFELWYRVRDGTSTRHEFIQAVQPIRQQVNALLTEAASYEIGAQEKTPLAKTVRTCRHLLQVEPALWLFATVEGVEPTNNAAERAIRPAVLWRRTSFGSQSEAGSTFMARMLTVVTTLRSQNRNVLEYITDACRAARDRKPAPSLLPTTANSQDQVLPAA